MVFLSFVSCPKTDIAMDDKRSKKRWISSFFILIGVSCLSKEGQLFCNNFVNYKIPYGMVNLK
jgi:drug/metabolite transporter (DMT)-like permease